MNSTRKNIKFLKIFDFFICNLKIKLKAQNINPIDTNINFDEDWYSKNTHEKNFFLIEENIFNQLYNITDLELNSHFYQFLDDHQENVQKITSDVYIMY